MNPFKPRSWRSARGRMAGAVVAGAAAVVVTGALGAGVAGAAPSAGAPHFNAPQVSEQIRGSGSDTTFFMMQRIGDIYSAAGLYGCQLVTAAGQNLFGGGTSVTGDTNAKCQNGAADIATTDDNDNWNRVEVSQGVNSVGSGAGQNQLCGAAATPDPVNFARSSKPSAGLTGCNEQELGYAKDGVPVVDFPTINPSTFGTSSFGSGSVASNAFPNGAYSSINGGSVGPVANGWLPGDNPAGTANHGTKLGSISNVGALDSSVAFRLWCQPHPSSNLIGDWGQLTNLGPNLEVNVDTTSGSPTVSIDASSGTTFSSTIASGQGVTDPFATLNTTPFAAGTTTSSAGGASTLTLSNNATATGTFTLTFATGAAKLAQGSGVPIGIPIRIVGVNTGSGTTFTFAQFADGQTRDTTNGCTSSATLSDVNAANDPNGATAPAGNPQHIALENNAHQLELFSGADFPSDPVDQAIEEATSLYFMSNGVYNTNAFVGQTTVNGANFAANLVGENNIFSGAATELNNTYPTARTLSNIINSATVTESTAGFMNWICDSNVNFSKGVDLNSGLNYDSELSNIISTNFGFPRLSDTTNPIAATPADNVIAPNDDCVAHIPVTANGTNTVTYAGSGTNFPASIVNGGTVTGTGLPAGTTVTSSGGSSTLTLSNPLSTSGTLEFFGVPAVITASATP
jgi:hypothetical protein